MRERGSERKREREKAEIWLPDVLFLFFFFVKTIPGPSEGGLEGGNDESGDTSLDDRKEKKLRERKNSMEFESSLRSSRV